MNSEERGPWYLLTGLIIGLVIGLVYAWVIDPIDYQNIAPSSLEDNYKEQYRALIASAFMSSGQLERARARLTLLEDEDVERELTIQAQRALSEGRPQSEVHALGLLALSLNQGAVSMENIPIPTAAAPTPSPTLPVVTAASSPNPILTSTPSASLSTGDTSPTATTPVVSPTVRSLVPTLTPLPTLTPTVAPGAPFILAGEAELVCDPEIEKPLLMVEAYNKSGTALQGIEVVVNWAEGEEHFFTGLKPEIGPGYADFVMTPGIAYTVHLSDGGQPVSGLIATECQTPAGERIFGSWFLVFIEP